MKRGIENFLIFETNIESFDAFSYKNINFYGTLRTYFSYTLFINLNKARISPFVRIKKVFKTFFYLILSLNLKYFKKSSVIFLAEFNDYQYDGKNVSYEVFETMFDFLISKNSSFEIIKFQSNNEIGPHYRNFKETNFIYIYDFISLIVKLIAPISYVLNFKKFRSISSNFYFGTFSPIRCSFILNETYLMYLVGKLIINIKRPKYFICSSFTSLPFQGILLAAKEKNVDFIDIQHGTIFDLNYTYTNNFIRKNQLPDKYLVYSNFEFQKLKVLKNVFTTGNLRIEFYNRYQKIKSIKYESFILFTLQYDITDEMLKFFLDSYLILVKRYNLKVKIRLHPRSIHDEVLKSKILIFLNKHDLDEILFISKIPLFEVLNSTLLHITINSSVFLDALNFGVNSLILNSKFSDDFLPYLSTGLMKIVSENDMIDEILSQLKISSNNRSVDHKYFDYDCIFEKI